MAGPSAEVQSVGVLGLQRLRYYDGDDGFVRPMFRSNTRLVTAAREVVLRGLRESVITGEDEESVEARGIDPFKLLFVSYLALTQALCLRESPRYQERDVLLREIQRSDWFSAEYGSRRQFANRRIPPGLNGRGYYVPRSRPSVTIGRSLKGRRIWRSEWSWEYIESSKP